MVIYLYGITQKKSHTESEEGPSIPHSKFVGLSLWLIAYFIGLIFTKNVSLLSTAVLICGCSLLETILLKEKGSGDEGLSAFNFSNNNTKMTYAKGKFLLALAVGALYQVFAFFASFGA